MLSQKTCQPPPDPETPQVVFSQSPGASQHHLQTQQFSEQDFSHVYQHPVHLNTQTDLLELQRQLTPPLQPANPVSQTPGVPAESTQHNVLLGQLYQQQQQHLIHPSGAGTVQHNRPAEVDPLTLVPLQQVVVPPLVNQLPPVPNLPPTMQQNYGVAQDFANLQPVYCSQSCPPDSSNCCFQLAFHQHYHHILPLGPGNAQLIYAGLPGLLQVASPPVPPAGNGAHEEPPEGSLCTGTDLPVSSPVAADSSVPRWLVVSDRPHQLQTSQYRQTLRNPGAQFMTQLYGQRTAPPLNNQGPLAATRAQPLNRLRYVVHPNRRPSQSVSPQQLYPTGPGQFSRAYVLQRRSPSPDFQQVVQDVHRPEAQRTQLHERFNLVHQRPGQRTISVQSLPKGF